MPGGLAKVPERTVERHSVINKIGAHSERTGSRRVLPNEYSLTFVRLVQPLVCHKNSREVIEIDRVPQKAFWKKIKNSIGFWIYWAERTKVPFALDGDSLVADIEIEPVIQQAVRQSKQAERRRRNTQRRQDGLSHPLIDKRSFSLGVVKKFGDVAASIIALDEARLGAAPHGTDNPLNFDHSWLVSLLPKHRH